MRLFKRRCSDPSPQLVSLAPLTVEDDFEDPKLKSRSGHSSPARAPATPLTGIPPPVPSAALSTWGKKVGKKLDKMKRADSSEILSSAGRRKNWSPSPVPSNMPNGQTSRAKRISRVESLRNLFSRGGANNHAVKKPTKPCENEEWLKEECQRGITDLYQLDKVLVPNRERHSGKTSNSRRRVLSESVTESFLEEQYLVEYLLSHKNTMGLSDENHNLEKGLKTLSYDDLLTAFETLKERDRIKAQNSRLSGTALDLWKRNNDSGGVIPNGSFNYLDSLTREGGNYDRPKTNRSASEDCDNRSPKFPKVQFKSNCKSESDAGLYSSVESSVNNLGKILTNMLYVKADESGYESDSTKNGADSPRNSMKSTASTCSNDPAILSSHAPRKNCCQPEQLVKCDDAKLGLNRSSVDPKFLAVEPGIKCNKTDEEKLSLSKIHVPRSRFLSAQEERSSCGGRKSRFDSRSNPEDRSSLLGSKFAQMDGRKSHPGSIPSPDHQTFRRNSISSIEERGFRLRSALEPDNSKPPTNNRRTIVDIVANRPPVRDIGGVSYLRHPTLELPVEGRYQPDRVVSNKQVFQDSLVCKNCKPLQKSLEGAAWPACQSSLYYQFLKNRSSKKPPANPATRTAMSSSGGGVKQKELKRIRLMKDETGELGIYIERQDPSRSAASSFMISYIEPNGVVDRDGRLSVGDEIVKVNSSRLRGLTIQEARRTLQNTPTEVEIVISRDTNKFEPDYHSQERFDPEKRSHHQTKPPSIADSELRRNDDTGIRLDSIFHPRAFVQSSKRPKSTSHRTRIEFAPTVRQASMPEINLRDHASNPNVNRPFLSSSRSFSNVSAADSNAEQTKSNDATHRVSSIGEELSRKPPLPLPKFSSSKVAQEANGDDPPPVVEPVTGMKKFSCRPRAPPPPAAAPPPVSRHNSLNMSVFTITYEKGGGRNPSVSASLADATLRKGIWGFLSRPFLPPVKRPRRAPCRKETRY
ncbi:unnamed protein product [Bemisia tabaci]|uniref:PDZ domain-containing protein n=1 Tax=Bemisia tabaci TaxID=7038 RepID=A0A9P0F6N5_BEMTA|nr:unnamed protein product [Bemisia tabaci]